MLGRISLIRHSLIGGKPHFKSKKAPRQGFKTDRAKVVNGKLRLDKPRGIKTWFDIPTYEALKMKQIKVASVFRERGTLLCRSFL